MPRIVTMNNKGLFFRIPFLLILLFFVGCDQSPRNFEDKPNSGPINRHPGSLIYTKHAKCRMACRHITDKEIKEILERGMINYSKSEPDSKPDPKYAFEGYTDE